MPLRMAGRRLTWLSVIVQEALLKLPAQLVTKLRKHLLP